MHLDLQEPPSGNISATDAAKGESATRKSNRNPLPFAKSEVAANHAACAVLQLVPLEQPAATFGKKPAFQQLLCTRNLLEFYKSPCEGGREAERHRGRDTERERERQGEREREKERERERAGTGRDGTGRGEGVRDQNMNPLSLGTSSARRPRYASP